MQSPQEVYDAELEELVVQLLTRLGEDPQRDGLRRTPLRVAKSLDFLTDGYDQDLATIVNGALFAAEHGDAGDSVVGNNIVLVRDIEFYSMCEHHMLPFYGKVHIGYIPDKNIIGLSKLARITDLFARRLQVQERITNQIADALVEVLEPRGVAVVSDASHFCMMMRGIQKQGSSTVVSSMRGVFRQEKSLRAEFMGLIKN
jgi:GTP cyclohydrolase I